MKEATPVQGEATGWRVVRADKQMVATGVVYYLQIELHSHKRCEVHEKKVFVEATGAFKIMGDDLLPCDASLPRAPFSSKWAGPALRASALKAREEDSGR